MATRSSSPSRLWCWAIFAVASAARCLGAQEAPPARTATSIVIPENWDAKTCLIAARTALARGDLDAAEALALQAENTPRGLIAILASRWSDTPAKVFRDIESARARQRATLIENIQSDESHGQREEKKAAPKIVAAGDVPRPLPKAAPAFPPIVAVSDFSLTPAPPTTPRANPRGSTEAAVSKYQQAFFSATSAAPFKRVRIDEQDPRELLARSIRAFTMGDAATARAYADEAKKRRADSEFSKEDIERLRTYLHDHAAAASR